MLLRKGEKEREVYINGEEIDDIVCSALEGGICYWCDRIAVKYPSEGYLAGEEWASEQLTKGGTLVLWHEDLDDPDKDATSNMDLDAFLRGLTLFLESNDTYCGYDLLEQDDKGSYRLDDALIDANLADSIVQYAVFGELVFA